jgi:hypothetical protein
MITKTQAGRKLVASFAQSILGEIAPEEMEDFDILVEDYFDNPEAQDLSLGAGLGALPDVAYVLDFVIHVLEALLHSLEVKAGVWRKGKFRREVLEVLLEISGEIFGDPSRSAMRSATQQLQAKIPEITEEMVENAIEVGRRRLGETVPKSSFSEENATLLSDWIRHPLRDISRPEAVDLILIVRWLSGPQTLHYELHSPSAKVPFQHSQISGEVKLERIPETLQEELWQACREDAVAGVEDLKATSGALSTFGHKLYAELFSAEMRAAYRRFRLKVKTIQIYSDEPWIPWELVKPYDASDPEAIIDDEFFCLKFQLTRWLTGGLEGPATRISLERLATVDAGSASSWKPVERTAQECELVSTLAEQCTRFSESSPPYASLSALLSLFQEARVDLLHCVGPGEFNTNEPDTSRILFNIKENDALRPSHLSGPFRTSIRRHRPLVFLHSEEAGRLGWSLSELGGWPARWVKDCCCGAFVAPLTEVDRDLAIVFVEAFYGALKNGETFGVATQTARQKVWAKAPANPAWCTYVIYAHPNGRLELD